MSNPHKDMVMKRLWLSKKEIETIGECLDKFDMGEKFEIANIIKAADDRGDIR